MHRLLAVALPACLALAQPAAARGGRPNVKPGISAAALERYQRRERELLVGRGAASMSRGGDTAARLDRLIGEDRDRVRAAFGRLRGAGALEAELKSLSDGAERVAAITETKEWQAAHARWLHSADDLRRRWLPRFGEAWRSSRVDSMTLNRSLLRSLSPSSKLRWARSGPWSYVTEAAEVAPVSPTPATALTFRAPFTVAQRHLAFHGLGTLGHAAIYPDHGETGALVSSYVAGGGDARAAMGIGVTVPEGFRQLRVQVQYDGMQSIGGMAYAGACGSGVGTFIEVIGPDHAARYLERETWSGWAAGMWEYHQEIGTVATGGTSQWSSVATFDIPADGGEYAVYGGKYAWAWSGGPILAHGQSAGNVREISVEALP